MPASPAYPCWAWPSPSGVPSTSQGSLSTDTLLKTKIRIDVVLHRNCFQKNNLFQNHKLLVSMFNLCSRLYCMHICRCVYIYNIWFEEKETSRSIFQSKLEPMTWWFGIVSPWLPKGKAVLVPDPVPKRCCAGTQHGYGPVGVFSCWEIPSCCRRVTSSLINKDKSFSWPRNQVANAGRLWEVEDDGTLEA